MKLSISVPNELWDRARAAGNDANPSHLVQEALHRYVEERGRKPAYPLTPPDDVASAKGAVRERFANEARKKFEDGYRAALTAFPVLSWNDIEFLANSYRFDVKRWAHSYAALAEDPDLRKAMPGYVSQFPEGADVDAAVVQALMNALGAWAAPHGMSEWEPGATYARGFEQAARDVWREITEGTPERAGTQPDEES